jgi:hypothetical protein
MMLKSELLIRRTLEQEDRLAKRHAMADAHRRMVLMYERELALLPAEVKPDVPSGH